MRHEIGPRVGSDMGFNRILSSPKKCLMSSYVDLTPIKKLCCPSVYMRDPSWMWKTGPSWI